MLNLLAGSCSTLRRECYSNGQQCCAVGPDVPALEQRSSKVEQPTLKLTVEETESVGYFMRYDANYVAARRGY